MKDDRYWKILDAVVRLEVVKGHLRWTLSDLARLSGVGRTLIYYYFGKSKKEILRVAMKLIGDEFFGLSEDRMKMWAEGQVRESVLKSRELCKKAPHMIEFYFHWRHHEGDLCDELVSLEKRYLRKIKSVKPHLSADQAAALFSMLFALVVVPDLKVEAIDIVLAQLG